MKPRGFTCVLHAAGFTEGIEANRSNRGQQEEAKEVLQERLEQVETHGYAV